MPKINMYGIEAALLEMSWKLPELEIAMKESGEAAGLHGHQVPSCPVDDGLEYGYPPI